MITLNNRPEPHEDGMTVRSLITKLKYSYPVLTVRLNGTYVDDADYETTAINDDDKVDILHPICGG